MTENVPITVLDSLNLGLHQAFQDDPQLVILGEDILDPYGGAFKVTRGLSSAYPDRVLTTPISEAGITGIAGGMALRGLPTVVEIMFGDFSTLIADQVINHIAKFKQVYQSDVPLVIRTPMGGRRGYGPTHSQTLEKLFLGVSGLTVIAPFHIKGESKLGAPGQLLYEAVIGNPSPVFFVENKLQYLLKLLEGDALSEFELETIHATGEMETPTYRLTLKSAPIPTVTLAAYGYMAHLALEALHQLAYQDEIFCELIIPTQLAPFYLEPLFASVGRTHNMLAIEEGTLSLGWGAEVLARTAEAMGSELHRVARLGAQESVIPAAPGLESEVLPGSQDIVDRVREMVYT
jgi:pyruvate/2-oxoglutarate/acetoin dehydrogenase E1 component